MTFVFLAVVNRPRITYITTPPLLRIGQNVSLRCTASGLGLLNVTWYKGEVVATTNHGNGTSEAVLRLYNITIKDWGEYVCVAKNAVGNENNMRTVYLRSKLYLLVFSCITNSSFRLNSPHKNNRIKCTRYSIGLAPFTRLTLSYHFKLGWVTPFMY